MSKNKSTKTSFWDFRSVKIYTTWHERILDFMAGLFISRIIIEVFLRSLSLVGFEDLEKAYFNFPSWKFALISFLIFLIYVVLIFCIVYLWRRRKYFAAGFLIQLIQLSLGLIFLPLYYRFFPFP
jgi:hypothetical protein